MVRSLWVGSSCFLGFILSWTCQCDAYFLSRPLLMQSSLVPLITKEPSLCHSRGYVALLAARDTEEEDSMSSLDPDGEEIMILRGSDADDIDGAVWEDLETGQPPKWLIMKELLGINIFTYILGTLIVFFLSMNVVVGPGWLGQMMGMPGVGAFNEVSQSFPDTIDLSSPEFRL